MTIEKEVAILERMTTRDLQTRYAEVFGEGTRVHNRTWLIKRIAWRIQALAEGDLSERARQRAAELANDADLRLSPPQPKPAGSAPAGTTSSPRFLRDNRLPEPGTMITRAYKGQLLQIQVLQTGFEFAGKVYPSLSCGQEVFPGTFNNTFLVSVRRKNRVAWIFRCFFGESLNEDCKP